MHVGRGKWAALLLGASAAALVAGGLVAFREEVREWWRRVPVTRTWADLLASRPIDLDDGVTVGRGITVRLGIESTRCPRWSGVLVYCLVEGDMGLLKTDAPMEQLGPLLVTVTGPAAGDEREVAKASAWRAAPSWPGPWLFARSIAIARAGNYRVSLRAADGKVLGTALVRGTEEEFHPWLTFVRSPRLVDDRSRTRPYLCSLAPRWSGIALPSWDGLSPCSEAEAAPALASPERPLPRLVPAAPDPDIDLQVQGGDLVLTCSGGAALEPGLEWQLLARWWVNGKAHFPFPAIPGLEDWHLERQGGKPLLIQNAILRLDWNPAAIGARPGDRIGLQLLYAPGGWDLVGDTIGLEKLVSIDDPHRALLTNRVELPAP